MLLPSTTGDFGVMPGHVPTVAQLRPGVITVHKELDKVCADPLLMYPLFVWVLQLASVSSIASALVALALPPALSSARLCLHHMP